MASTLDSGIGVYTPPTQLPTYEFSSAPVEGFPYSATPLDKRNFDREEEFGEGSYELAPKRKNLDGFQMHHANTCLTELGELQGRVYRHFAERGDQSTGWNVFMRVVLPGLGLAVASATLTLAFKVGAVAEVTLKGLGNILGGIFFQPKCDIERGLNMLVTELPVSLFKLGVSIAIEIPLRGAITLVAMTFYPSSYCKIECKDHESTHEMLENANQITDAQLEKYNERSDMSLKERISKLTQNDLRPKVSKYEAL